MPRTAQLGQARPADTTPVSIFSPSKRDRCKVESIIICNTTASAAAYRIFIDADGSTYDESTAIAYDVPLSGNSTTIFQVNMYINNIAGNLAVRTDTGNALTFTVNGEDGSVAY